MPLDLVDDGHIPYTNEGLADAAHAGQPDGPVGALAARYSAQSKAPHHDAPFDRKRLGALGAPSILARFIQVSYGEWSKMVLNARSEIWLAGIRLRN